MTEPSDAALRIAREIEREAIRANGGVYNPAAFIQRIAVAIDEAVREEREACAVAAETGYDDMVECDYDSGFNEGRTTAADAIRNRQP